VTEKVGVNYRLNWHYVWFSFNLNSVLCYVDIYFCADWWPTLTAKNRETERETKREELLTVRSLNQRIIVIIIIFFFETNQRDKVDNNILS